MDKKPKSEGEAASASSPEQPVTLTQHQFEQLLIAVRHHPATTLDPRQPLDRHQHHAFALFEKAAIGLGVTGYGTLARPLSRQGGCVIVDVPEHAAHARVYALSGVSDHPLSNVPEPWVLKHGEDDRIGRIEFFNASGVLLEVTGGEPAHRPRAVTAA